jgi:hypothetical protein
MGMRLRLVLPLLLVAACSAEPNPVARPLPTQTQNAVAQAVSPAPSGVLTERDCSGGCDAGFSLNGEEYILSCEPIPPSNLGPEVVGEGMFDDRAIDVRPIVSGYRSGAVAAGPLADFCGPRQPPTDWYLYAYPM